MLEFDAMLVEELPDAVVITTPEGAILYWNKGAESIFGYTSAEVVGHTVTQLVVPPDRIEEESHLLKRTLTSGRATFESLRRKKDGSLVYVDISNKLIKRPSSDEPLILITKKDITALKVQRDSKLMEAKFRDLLESTPDAIVMANPTGHIVFVNSNAEKLFGYEPGELRGNLVETLLPSRYRGRHIGHRSEYFAQPRIRTMGAGLELFGLRKDGTEFPVEISLSPLQMEETALVMSAIRDISERKRATQQFKDLLEAAPDAIVIVNQGGDIIIVNSQAETLFGYTRDELLGKKIELLLPPRYRGKHPTYREDFFSAPKIRRMGAGLELFGQRKNGEEFPVEISLSPLETADGTLVSSAIRDISERKRVEKILQEKNEELVRANQAKNRFLASMSHELRTPLNSIIGFTGTLLMKLPGPLNADQETQLRTVQGSGKHLLSLINDLLDLAKIEADEFSPNLGAIDCAGLAEEVVRSLRPQAEAKGLGLDLTVEGQITLWSDRRALHQIIINLVNNAIKFTEHGSVQLTARRASMNGKENIEICVVDTGIGIPAEDQAKLFSAFSRIEQAGDRIIEGTGLGLYLSQRLANVLGGKISFVSEYGKGSTFTLVLPGA